MRPQFGIMAVIVVTGWLLQPALARAAEPPTAAGETVEVTGVNQEPLTMTRLPQPRYPREAKGVAGWVRVECQVSPQGRIQSVRVIESQPAGVFDQAAIAAMQKARFKPFKSAAPRLMVQRLIFSPN